MTSTIMANTNTKAPSLQAILNHHRQHRSGSFDRDTPFSWTRAVVFLCSYFLVLSDVFRSGLGLQRIDEYPPLEPNVGLFLGPYGYLLNRIESNATHDQTTKIWAYKFDTTAIALQAVAQFLKVKEWPPCVLYKEPCASNTMSSLTVFKMLDSLVQSVAGRQQKRTTDLPNITLRTENIFFDRLHDYLFPLFQNRRRTVQAIYYNSNIFESDLLDLCSRRRNQPYACNDLWVNFNSTCSPINEPCVESRTVWTDIIARSRLTRKKYAGLRLDMLLLEGYEDRGIASMSFQGRQLYDITSIVRVRNCSEHSPNECSTVIVEDHRYEGASLASDVAGWYTIIATIRVLGQSYAWLRLFMLFMGCYCARSVERVLKGSSRTKLAIAALRTMFTAPSQVVTYGSIVPVGLYTLAHLIDSMMVYEKVAQQYNGVQGVFHMNPRQFIRVATISMRSLWVLSTALHVVLLLRTRCCWASTSKGIPGIPEFFVSSIAFLTISAQYRSISFRNARLIHIFEVEPSWHLRSLHAARYNNTRGLWFCFAFGDHLDLKCLIASLCAVLTSSVVLWGFVRILINRGLIPACEFFIWPHTIVSYAAGTLWPANALIVSWNGYIFTPVNPRRHRSRRIVATSPAPDPPDPMLFKFDASRIGTLASTAFIINHSKDSRVIRNAVAILDGRSREVHATLCLMNLTVMTDPVVFCRLYWFGGHEINIYRSSRYPKQLHLIPKATADSVQNQQIDCSTMELLASVNSMELPWSDLIHCG